MSDRDGAAAGSPGRGARRWREVLLALMLLFAYGYFVQLPAWNEFSRYDLVRALVEEGTTRIDSFHDNTGDKALYNGHYYSDKAPGSSLLGVPAYALLRAAYRATGAGTPDDTTAVAALTFAVSGVSTAILVLLLVRFLRPVAGERWALVVGVGLGFGSIAFPFATMYFGHAASAAALFAAFYLLHRRARAGSRWDAVVAGLLAGTAVVIEIPVVLGVAVLGIYALSLGPRIALRFVVGGIPAAIVLLGYNWLTFDNPLSIGYQYATVFGDQNRQGIVSIVWPSLATAGDLLLSERGLLRLAPWFALAPLGLLAVRRKALRAEVLVCAGICTAFLAYNSGAINPFGGWTPGPRYLTPALPFAAILVALAPMAVRRGPARDAIRIVTVALIAGSIMLMLVATTTMPNAPERFADPLYEWWIPRLTSGFLAETLAWRRWGLHGLEPLVPLCLGLGLGAAALVLSFRRHGRATRAMTAIAVALVGLVVAFSLPFPQAAASTIANGGGSGGPALSIVDVGATSVVTGTTREASLWAQIENAGPAVPGTRVRFDVYTPAGERSWTAWHADVDWAADQRRTMTASWDTTGVEPGDYRLEVTVVSEGSGAGYADAVDAEPIRVRP